MFKTFASILAFAIPIIANEATIRVRQTTPVAKSGRTLTECDTLKACYLINIKTREETILDGYDHYTIDTSNEHGYTIRCDVNGVNELDFIKFFYSGVLQEEFGLPRYMNGDANQGGFLNKVDYLSTCGRKLLTIEGHVWSHQCFTKKFYINAKNPKGIKCKSPPTSTISPISAPISAPISNPISIPAPVDAPVTMPVVTPVSAPVTSPTNTCKPAISSFTLVDSISMTDIMPLAGTIDHSTDINIRANVAICDPNVVDSVLIELDGKTRCERHAPYNVYGDASHTDVTIDKTSYYSGTLTVGTHIIKATPFTGEKCDGMAGESFAQAFTVTA